MKRRWKIQISSFLKFIEEDIEAKKTLLATMPNETKRDIKKFNDRITSISEKYNEYKAAVKKYIDTKSKSFEIKKTSNDVESISNRVNALERVRFVLNPTNTYFEKMGFDNLLYEISNYYDFNFTSLNEIINKFLDKFELADIKLSSADFDYTCYVNEYMTAFLETRQTKSDNYDKVSSIFEHIYWANPEIIEHVELNFRKLIKKNEKKLITYIEKFKKQVMAENSINSYEECLDKLKATYNELNLADKEDISDIITLAKNGTIDINNYFEDSKVRVSTYSSLIIDLSNPEDKFAMDKFYESLEKLKTNIEEYSNYIKFLPLINDFKAEYEKQIPKDEKDTNRSDVSKNLKSIESQIAEKESKLEKLNKKTSGGGLKLFGPKNNDDPKLNKIESIKLAKELYALYKTYDSEYFKDKVLSILSSSITISELLHLYYSFDYFKKKTIKKVFEVTSYDDIIKYSDSFDLFAMNPTNIIINGMSLFEENNIARVIMNKYRLDNINLTEEDLNPDSVDILMDKVQLLLRIKVIESSKTTVEKIWFMAQVQKFNNEKDKKE